MELCFIWNSRAAWGAVVSPYILIQSVPSIREVKETKRLYILPIIIFTRIACNIIYFSETVGLCVCGVCLLSGRQLIATFGRFTDPRDELVSSDMNSSARPPAKWEKCWITIEHTKLIRIIYDFYIRHQSHIAACSKSYGLHAVVLNQGRFL